VITTVTQTLWSRKWQENRSSRKLIIYISNKKISNYLIYAQHAHSIFQKWVSVPTTFEKSGYMLKNMGTLYKTKRKLMKMLF